MAPSCQADWHHSTSLNWLNFVIQVFVPSLTVFPSPLLESPLPSRTSPPRLSFAGPMLYRTTECFLQCTPIFSVPPSVSSNPDCPFSSHLSPCPTYLYRSFSVTLVLCWMNSSHPYNRESTIAVVRDRSSPLSTHLTFLPFYNKAPQIIDCSHCLYTFSSWSLCHSCHTAFTLITQLFTGDPCVAPSTSASESSAAFNEPLFLFQHLVCSIQFHVLLSLKLLH